MGEMPHAETRLSLSSGTSWPAGPSAAGRRSWHFTWVPRSQPAGPPQVPSAPGTAQDLKKSSPRPSDSDGSTHTDCRPATLATTAAVSKQRSKGEEKTHASGGRPSLARWWAAFCARAAAWSRPLGVSGGSQGRSAVGTHGWPRNSTQASSRRSPCRARSTVQGLPPSGPAATGLGTASTPPLAASARCQTSPSLQCKRSSSTVALRSPRPRGISVASSPGPVRASLVAQPSPAQSMASLRTVQATLPASSSQSPSKRSLRARSTLPPARPSQDAALCLIILHR
mmetsp:Transcript_50275/g.145785  ORF Transcript_50275/g.145785 Transcript_50275/m.145785 type:complete len:284 (+) Transcript_50275:359-1210(+)